MDILVIFQFKNGAISNLDLVIYLSSYEIDGLFDVEKDINLSIFQAPDIYNNKNEDLIKGDSLMVYEINSGDQEKKSWLKQWWKNAILFINI